MKTELLMTAVVPPADPAAFPDANVEEIAAPQFLPLLEGQFNEPSVVESSATEAPKDSAVLFPVVQVAPAWDFQVPAPSGVREISVVGGPPQGSPLPQRPAAADVGPEDPANPSQSPEPGSSKSTDWFLPAWFPPCQASSAECRLPQAAPAAESVPASEPPAGVPVPVVSPSSAEDAPRVSTVAVIPQLPPGCAEAGTESGEARVRLPRVGWEAPAPELPTTVPQHAAPSLERAAEAGRLAGAVESVEIEGAAKPTVVRREPAPEAGTDPSTRVAVDPERAPLPAPTPLPAVGAAPGSGARTAVPAGESRPIPGVSPNPATSVRATETARVAESVPVVRHPDEAESSRVAAGDRVAELPHATTPLPEKSAAAGTARPTEPACVAGPVVGQGHGARPATETAHEKTEPQRAESTRQVVPTAAVVTEVITRRDPPGRMIREDAPHPPGWISGPSIRGDRSSPAAADPGSHSASAPAEPPDAFMFHLADRIRIVAGGDAGQIRVQLRPEHLGQLEIRAISGASGVAAKILAESEPVREYLAGNLQVLEQALAEQGLKVSRIEVSLQDFADPQAGRRDPGQHHSGSRAGADTGSGDRPDRMDSGASAAVTERLSTRTLAPHSTFHTIA